MITGNLGSKITNYFSVDFGFSNLIDYFSYFPLSKMQIQSFKLLQVRKVLL